MTKEEAIKMAKADLECMERDTSGQDEMCNSHKCVECSLNYERGNVGEQKEWLRMAIKSLEQMSEWIPVNERMPEDEEDVLIQYGDSMIVGYHKVDYTVYPPGFEDLDETGWYDEQDEFICVSYQVIAWMPLPEPYKAESEGKDTDKCTYKETGCGSCKRQLDCPINAESEVKECI